MNVFRTFGSDLTASAEGNGKAKEGEVNFAFIDMGQGDCTIISDPDNNVYIIDCGSARMTVPKYFDEAKKIVRAWAKDSSVTVIVTHPDYDHYNAFIDLLVIKPKVDVSAIYFSRARADNAPLANYRVSGFNINMAAFGYPALREVTLNDTSNFLKKWRKGDANYTNATVEAIPKTGYVIRSGTTAKNKKWSITIIAGNVATTQSPESATANNVVSLCTLIKLGDEKALLTGDSTEETLTYLYNNQKAHFKECTIFQVPHHGSESSIPTDNFKNYVNPQTLLVSVGYGTYTHKLPRNIVLEQWLTCTRLRNISMVYDEWVYAVPGYNKTDDLNDILKNEWKNYNTGRTRTFYFLTDPDDGVKSGTGFWGFTRSFYFIYRRSVKKDIFTTGIYGNLTNQSFGEETALENNPNTEDDGH
jgi:beta-lactamase superfamily II metal-dependent hydrolase